MDTCDSPIEEIIIDYLPEQDIHNGDLHSCPICNRKFRSDVYEKHVAICERMAAKKRKTFDSSRQRREGTDMALYLPKNFGLQEYKEVKSPAAVKEHTPPPKQKPDAVKEATPFKRDPIRLSKRNTQPVSEQFPHCERCFGMKAFDRHVEWCEKKARLNIHSTPKSLNAAREKLETRTKYKPPSLKNKRDLNREKYSGELSCGTSMNSILSDSFSIGKRSKSNSIERERKSSVASMTSSITSDSQDDTARAIFGDEHMGLIDGIDACEDISLGDMHLNLDFDKDECENKLKEHESILNQKGGRNNFERQNKLDASNYMVQETISSLKLKSQFQISKRQFFAKVGIDKPKITTSQGKAVNLNSSLDKLALHYSTPKNNVNLNSAGTIKTSPSTSSLCAEPVAGKKKFNSSRKSNEMSPMKNSELIVESYGFANKPDMEEFVVEKKAFQENPLSDTASEKLDGTGTSKKVRDTVTKPNQKAYPTPQNFKGFNYQKAASVKPYYFQDSDMQLIQANESLDDSEENEEFKNPKSRPSATNIVKKGSLKSIFNNDGSRCHGHFDLFFVSSIIGYFMVTL